MRRICWACVVLAVVALSRPAAGFDSGYGWGKSCTSCEPCYTYGAPACGAPFFGWQPGCCQDPPSPCDNAWAGYCEEKARWRAFCYRLGTGGKASCGSMPADCQPMPAVLQPIAGPLPPPPAAPGRSLAPLAPGRVGQPPGAAPPGWRAQPPVTVGPGDPTAAPLPPAPADLQEPVALPPLPQPAPDETTRRRDWFWLPSGNARTQPANWTGLR